MLSKITIGVVYVEKIKSNKNCNSNLWGSRAEVVETSVTWNIGWGRASPLRRAGRYTGHQDFTNIDGVLQKI